jgi:peptide-methionine (S)-S-oxide reductase
MYVQIINHTMRTFLISIFSIITLISCADSGGNNIPKLKENAMTANESTNDNAKTDTATFGQGCFWCAEAIFSQLEGVISVTSGYSGGTVENPSYKLVCSGTTGHAEVVQIVFDPSTISYADLLQAFWASHDPTTLNQQGADVGTQYRSVIFYHSEQQKELAEKYKKELDSSGAYKGPIITQIVPFEKFYKAENYHQEYYEVNGEQPYCQYVIRPKLEKFQKVFHNKLKKKS